MDNDAAILQQIGELKKDITEGFNSIREKLEQHSVTQALTEARVLALEKKLTDELQFYEHECDKCRESVDNRFKKLETSTERGRLAVRDWFDIAWKVVLLAGAAIAFAAWVIK